MDCLVIGAGPAGLTAAVYLARFRRTVTVIDGGASRASWIPVSHNLVGFPQGLSGDALLDRLRAQATQYGATILNGEVTNLALLPDGSFEAVVEAMPMRAQRVLLGVGALSDGGRDGPRPPVAMR